MKVFKLIKLELRHKSAYLEYIEEWGDEKMVPFSSRYVNMSYEEYLRNLALSENLDTVPNFRVPGTTLLFVDEFETILGVVNVRHFLNDALLQTGGHIGYGIRPLQRKKGYAKLMLQLALIEAKKLGITKALITCNQDNIPSKKTIESCHGIYENAFLEENGNSVLRYWIDL